ncbi:DUF368 domain-containing protein [Bacillus niameyensis]|uniref:DUF368 domain-containing protein n=1 Tax=Bacillus niameyensis TaxID=1522308 RepID=UPI00078101BF|nr:DUF368 domain-containing protein [Bacillus niameyensis]
MEWKNLLRGFIMGTTDLIPGVSGGTVAFVLGIYDRLLASISGFFSRDWKKHIGFLFPLALGMGVALVLLSKGIDYLLEYHEKPTQFFFMGLVIGVLPFIMKQADVKRNFSARHYIALIIIAILLASLGFLQTNENADPITTLNIATIIGLFFSGWLASMAMLLPGISGSFVLLLLGVYSTAINALSTMNIPVILTIGAGVIVGFVVSSKAIQYLLSHFQHLTYALIIGLIIGSIFVIYPGIPSGRGIILSLITFLIGLILSYSISLIKKPTDH